MSEEATNETKPTSTKGVIVVGEDDKAYARIYRVKLEKEGFDVAVANDGNQVLRLVEEKKPDLILLDLIMPAKDGFETLKALKEDANTKAIPVIVFSNLGQEEDIKKVKNLGAIDYYIKSNLSIQEVISKVEAEVAKAKT